jgi:hypothetical protein
LEESAVSIEKRLSKPVRRTHTDASGDRPTRDVAEKVALALDYAAGAASAAGQHTARSLLETSNEELGRMFKESLRRVVASFLERYELVDVGPAEAEPPSEEPLGEGFPARPLDARRDLIRNGQLVDALELCRRLGISRQALNKSIDSHRNFAVDVAESFYPAFYADPELDRKHLEKVSQLLGARSGASKYHFFTTPSDFLGGVAPLEALRVGRFEDVKLAAAAYAER